MGIDIRGNTRTLCQYKDGDVVCDCDNYEMPPRESNTHTCAYCLHAPTAHLKVCTEGASVIVSNETRPGTSDTSDVGESMPAKRSRTTSANERASTETPSEEETSSAEVVETVVFFSNVARRGASPTDLKKEEKLKEAGLPVFTEEQKNALNGDGHLEELYPSILKEVVSYYWGLNPSNPREYKIVTDKMRVFGPAIEFRTLKMEKFSTDLSSAYREARRRARIAFRNERVESDAKETVEMLQEVVLNDATTAGVLNHEEIAENVNELLVESEKQNPCPETITKYFRLTSQKRFHDVLKGVKCNIIFLDFPWLTSYKMLKIEAEERHGAGNVIAMRDNCIGFLKSIKLVEESEELHSAFKMFFMKLNVPNDIKFIRFHKTESDFEEMMLKRFDYPLLHVVMHKSRMAFHPVISGVIIKNVPSIEDGLLCLFLLTNLFRLKMPKTTGPAFLCFKSFVIGKDLNNSSKASDYFHVLAESLGDASTIMPESGIAMDTTEDDSD